MVGSCGSGEPLRTELNRRRVPKIRMNMSICDGDAGAPQRAIRGRVFTEIRQHNHSNELMRAGGDFHLCVLR